MNPCLPALLVLGALVAAPPASAAVRGSARYSVTTDALTAGGGRSTNATVANDGVLGGFVSMAAAPATTAKHGLAGQIYEATLQLAASPTNLNEGSTLQIQAFQRVDDGSTNTIPPAQVAWGIASGPLASVSSNGLVTAANVYQDTTAVVRGLFEASTAGLTLLVANTGLDNWGAYAGDGIDDAWQVQYFGLASTNAGPARDPDGDGQNNLFEFTAGTTPTNAASRFELSIRNGLAAGQRQVVFRPRLASRTYTVTYRTNAADATPLLNLGSTSTSDSGDERTVTDLGATATNRFYKVRISYP
jgi:hypothetical protein